MERSSKAFYSALAVVSVLALGAGLRTGGEEGLTFGVFALLTLGGGLVCVWERSVVRSAFALMATFLGAAGFFLLLGADFLAMAQVLIYVGGILALILFGVMLSPPDLTERKMSRVLGALVAIGFAVAWIAVRVAATVEWAELDTLPPPQSKTERIGLGFLAPDQYVVAFELAAVVLTVALVAAVYIARRRKMDSLPGGPEEVGANAPVRGY